MKKCRRKATLIGLVLAAVGLAAWLALQPNEPKYQGKPLSWWLEQTDGWLGIQTPNTRFPTEAEVESQKREVTEALVGMGDEGLHHLVQLLEKPKKDSAIHKAILWINENQSFVSIPQKRPPPWAAFAGEAIRLLGSNATPILPELSLLLQKEATAGLASDCLISIGPPAAPSLMSGLTNKSEQVRSVSLRGLGNLGNSAVNAAPMIARLADSPDGLSGIAMRVLSEVDTNAGRFAPLFIRRFEDTNATFDAAFALGRIGSTGVPILLRGLTNSDRQIKIGSLAALQPEIAEYGRLGISNSDYSFGHISCLFNLKTLSTSWAMYQHEAPPPHLVVPVIARNLKFAEPDLSIALIQLAASYGIQGVPVLSVAAGDTNQSVRHAAREMLRDRDVETHGGAVTRGSRAQKRLALIFSAHEFAEGGEVVLGQLAARGAKGAFFLTGDFLNQTSNRPLIHRIATEGHYLGPHSDKHLLYCTWESPVQLLVTHNEFRSDLAANIQKVETAFRTELDRRISSPSSLSPEGRAPPSSKPRFFLPPFEHYNQDIANWAAEMNCVVINFTPGTRSNADYTGEADTNFVSSQAIFDSILKREREDPHGLNGFILLLHLGSGPRRADKFHTRFGELLDVLAAKGYQFVRVDELLEPSKEEETK